MNHTLLGISVSVFVLGSGPRVFADHISEVLDTWNPQMAAGLCGLAFDHTTGNVWVYECHAADLQSYSSDGTFLSSVPRPGGGGGGKAADQGEHATDGHAPDTAPDQRADRAGACARGSATLLLRQAPEVGAV